MFKLVILAVWTSAIAVLSSHAASEWRLSQARLSQAENPERIYEYRKTRVINVPVIADGGLLGYVIVQLIYAIDAKAVEKLNVNPDAFVLDYTFRTLYGDPSLDFRHLEKYDIGGLTRKIPTAINERLGAGMIKEVLVQDFAYMPREQAPR